MYQPIFKEISKNAVYILDNRSIWPPKVLSSRVLFLIATSAIPVLKVMEYSFFNQVKMYSKHEVLLRPLNTDGFSK